jgi:hypothetical protein
MTLSALGQVLEELSKLIQMKLELNQQSACLFQYQDVEVQIDLDRKEEFLLLTAKLGTIPIGKYREALFQEALRQNVASEAITGIFAYSKQADTLILFQMLPVKETNGDKLLACLNPFSAKVKVWKESIERGDVPVSSSNAQGGSFGLFSSKR